VFTDKKELIKRKIERLVNEDKCEEIDFLLVILSDDGIVQKDSLSVSFEVYKQRYGGEKFESVKAALIQEEAILKESDRGIELFHYERYNVARECAEVIFRLRKEQYLEKLDAILSNAEGAYLLGKLSSHYYDAIEQTIMDNLRDEIGKKHFDSITNDLLESNFLFKYSYSPQHTVWRLFSPIKSLFVLSDRDKEALAFIYIAQNVRSEGVLQSDCTKYNDTLPKLILNGFIRENQWYSHRLYLITDKATEKIKPIIQERLNKNKEKIEKLLDSAPPKLLQFLITEIFTQGYYPSMPRAHPEVLDLFSVTMLCGVKDGEHRCMLRDPYVRDWRNKILNKLKDCGVSFLAHSYVSTRGGIVRDLNYCLPKEVVDYLVNYGKKKGAIEILPPELERLHKIFHVFNELKNRYSIEELQLSNLLNRHGVNKEEFQTITDDLVAREIFTKTDKGYNIQHQSLCKDYIEENLFQPLIDNLLDKETKVTPIQKAPELKAPKKIEVPPKLPKKIEAITRSLEGDELSILLGENLVSRSNVDWKPSSEKNPHLLVVGTTGSGKTETMLSLVYELRKRGISCLILDFHNEYSEIADMKINIREGVTINPLELFERSPLDTIYETSSILRQIYSLGDQQEATLRQAIRKSYEDKGISDKDKLTWSNPPPNFLNVKENLEQMMTEGPSSIRSVIITLFNRLEPIFDIEIFSKATSIPFEEIVKRTTAIQLKDLPTDQVKTAASDFFLRRLWYYMYKLGQSKNLRLYCVVDEGHRLAYEKSPLDQFLREARKYGVGVMLSSQRPSDFTETVVANVGSIISLQCPLEKDAKFMAKQMNCAIKHIQFLDEVGKAIVKFSSKETPLTIQITPLSPRKG